MGYLKMVFDRYYESEDAEEKARLRKGFSTKMWDSLPYKKSNRTFGFDVVEKVVPDAEMREFFIPYQRLKYQLLKSRYNIKNIEKLALVKARINSNYGKYFDKEVYIHKDYYKHLAHVRNIYFYYVDGKYSTDEEVKNELLQTYNKAMQLKVESDAKKIELSWEDYQQFIEKCLDRIFENYIPYEEFDDWEDSEHLDWDEDNVVLRYINSSLNGYTKNLIADMKKPKEKFCTNCGCNINPKSNAKYCKDCADNIKREKTRERQRRFKEKKKQIKKITQ